jgi:hypothetical protein
MSSIGMMEARMPPGFRFHPRDEELVLDYLLHKLTGRRAYGGVDIVDVDLNKCEPWDLPGTSATVVTWMIHSKKNNNNNMDDS